MSALSIACALIRAHGMNACGGNKQEDAQLEEAAAEAEAEEEAAEEEATVAEEEVEVRSEQAHASATYANPNARFLSAACYVTAEEHSSPIVKEKGIRRCGDSPYVRFRVPELR